MSDKDTISNDYISDNEHFADAFNYYIYGGEQVIKPEELITEDVVEAAVIKKMRDILTVKKTRDLIRGVNIKSAGNVTYALLGIENQSLVHYAMPIRNMLYDALNYASQVSKAEKEIKKSNKGLNSAEYLSGFTKEHRIYPVVTLVINWDSRKWDGPIKLSEMFVDIDPLLRQYVDNYTIKLIDPHSINDFTKFNTMLGDVLEFIKEQKNDNFIENKLKEKGKSVEEIADDLEEKVEDIQGIYLIADEFKPEYDAEKIYDRLKKACK